MIQGDLKNGNGTIERLGDGTHIVRAYGNPYLLDQPGVYCENTDAEETERIYAKRFVNKQIFFQSELEEARNQLLSWNDTHAIRIGMTGYSKITSENLENWGIKRHAYERACEDILGRSIHALQEEYPGIKISIPDDASNMGVDLAITNVARFLDISHLGHSFPRFMMYVVDDNDAVIVCESQAAYSNCFIDNLDLLISVGGRLQALTHDIDSATEKGQLIVFSDLMPLLTETKANPPTRNATGQVQDATGAFFPSVIFFVLHGQRPNLYKSTFIPWVTGIVVEEVRNLISPEIAYGGWKQL